MSDVDARLRPRRTARCNVRLATILGPIRQAGCRACRSFMGPDGGADVRSDARAARWYMTIDGNAR